MQIAVLLNTAKIIVVINLKTFQMSYFSLEMHNKRKYTKHHKHLQELKLYIYAFLKQF